MFALVWNTDPVLVRIGPLAVRYYGICMLVTIGLGSFLQHRHLRRMGCATETAQLYLLYALTGFILGARLFHCLAYDPAHFLRHPVDVFKLWHGGVASHGAAIGLITAAWLFSRIHRIPFLMLTDATSFAAAVGATFVRIGNFFNSEILGKPSSLPWAVRFIRRSPELRHPSQLYEALGGLLILLLLLAMSRKAKNDKPGLFFGTFLVVYFLFRFFIEFAKEPQGFHCWLTLGQYVSIPFILAGALILLRRRVPPSVAAPDA